MISSRVTRARHFAPDAVQALGAALNPALYLVVGQQSFYAGQKDFKALVIFRLDWKNFFAQLFIVMRVQNLKAGILQPTPQITQAQTVGNGHQQIEDLLGHLPSGRLAFIDCTFQSQ